MDASLEQNLESCFLQDHPQFEIIFSVADPNDPAVPVVKKLLMKYPKVDARLNVGKSFGFYKLISQGAGNVGVNPKINNVIQGYRDAKYKLIWIMDSNVQVDPGCMNRSSKCFNQPKIGLVHHLPCGIHPTNFGSALECSYLNTTHSKMYMFLNFIAVDSCVNGKSNMYRRKDLESLGGLEYFGKYLAEDNVIGQAIMRKGYTHAMTTDLAKQSLGKISIQEFLKRRVRWIRVRKYTVTVGTLYEPFTECLLSGFLAALGFWNLFRVPMLPFLGLHVAMWFLCDTLVMARLDPSFVRMPLLFVFSWIFKELGAFPIWIMAMSGTTVEWRGVGFHLNTDGTVRDLHSAPSPLCPYTLPAMPKFIKHFFTQSQKSQSQSSDQPRVLRSQSRTCSKRQSQDPRTTK